MPVTQDPVGDERNDLSKTFIFYNEGHTIGTALRYIITSYPDVEFCGYTLPHPSKNQMHFRIQMYHGKARDALKRGFADLIKVCDATLEIFDEGFDTYLESVNKEQS